MAHLFWNLEPKDRPQKEPNFDFTRHETIDQKDTFSEVIPKEIVDSVLEEILVSVLTISEKGCNRIGDFNINEDFCQQYNQPLHVKDFEQANINQSSSAASLHSGRNKERSGNGNENSGADWLGKIEDKVKPGGECKVISEEILADNELQIQNGQIHLGRIKSSLESAREEYYQKENVIKDDKIEIEYYNEGKLNKIYVPLNEQSKESNLQSDTYPECEDENKKQSEKENFKNEDGNIKNENENVKYENENSKNENEDSKKENESPFKPFTTEDLRQVWDNENSSLVGKWDGDMASQPEEIVKLMEGLSNIRVYPEGSADPNRPRTCSVAEEDIKKMIKEIEEISFIQSHDTGEDYPPEGQGDADLESKSFTKSRDILNKPKTESRVIQNNEPKELSERSSDEMKKSQEEEVRLTEIRQDSDSESVPYIVKEPSTISMLQTLPSSQTNEMHDDFEEGRFEENILSEEHMLESNLQGETSGPEKLLTAETFSLSVEVNNASSIEDVKESIDFSATGSVDFLESRDRIFVEKVEIINSTSTSGNDIFSEFTVPSEIGVERTLPVPHSSTALKDKQDTHSFVQDIELPPGEKMKSILAYDNTENIEENKKRPSGYIFTEVQSQGSNGCSQSHKSSAESVTQSKGSGSLQSEDSVTSSENQWQEVDPENSESGKFKLHSIKMCLRMGCDPAGLQKKIMRSESQEAFVESTESVLQIIEPDENTQDEESGTVSFSLLPQETSEISQKPSAPYEVESKPDEDINNESAESDEIPQKKVYSGMTTIGPMKNVDYDPKDLTAPDVDFGKMTRITSSRQLAEDFNLLGADLTCATTVKILEENDFDESVTESDNECLETGSPVNRDIASLTKVQKIREVMSYQPKPEEDFEDEEVLPKTRLDLKDVESSTDERYKVPEVGIPLLSFEVTSETIGTEAEAEKQLIESMGLIISGLTEPYYENLEETNERNENSAMLIETSRENIQSVDSKKEVQSVNRLEEENIEQDIDFSPEPISETESKYRTLSGVIKKASKKFMKKDSDILLRNSKSLPRDTSKITTDRIKSILNESSTSASNVLKKSRSMLRSTQSLFKSISQNRMIDEVEKHKTSPSETDLSTVERKLSFLMERKKEDFTKAKNLIKSKMEKTFKKQERSSETAVEQPEVSEERKELLQVVIRNEEKLRVDRMENFKRWLPKSTLVYKSQFVKSQMKIKDKSQETDAGNKKEDDNDTDAQIESTNAADEETVAIQEMSSETETTFQQEQNEEAVEEFIVEEKLDITKEEMQPEFIVMETIQGLPTSDLESPLSEKENMETNATSREYERENDHQVNNTETQMVKEKELDIVPEYTEIEDKVLSKVPSERKMIAKKKKLSTRLRNFWCSAFGRVKTPPKKSDVS